jgi:outer membrane lipoprotein-sorting protein
MDSTPSLLPFALFLLTFLLGLPAYAQLTPESTIDQILDALDARGQGLTSFVANVKLTDTDAGLGDASSRTGKAWYQAGESPRLRVTFDKREANGRVTDEKVEYLLKGPDLIERTYRTKSQVTHHVLRPGEKLNLLKLGEGPFPLPIGQKKEDVHAMFEVKKIEPKPGDPANTVHLQLIPKPNTRFERKFKTLDVWVDQTDAMPRRIETLDRNETSVRTTDLSDVKVNAQLSDSDFNLPAIGTDWNLTEGALPD